MKEECDELYYREQVNWHRMYSASDLNAALTKLKPYSTTPDAGKSVRAISSRKMVPSSVRCPALHVPNEYDLLDGGKAQRLLQS